MYSNLDALEELNQISSKTGIKLEWTEKDCHASIYLLLWEF